MSDRQQLLESIAATTADYRAGELPAPTAEHVERWVNQFDIAVQLPILREMDHILKKTYFSRERVKMFLVNLANNPKLVGNDPASFWRSIGFIDRQGGGNSQHEMLEIFSKLLDVNYGIGNAVRVNNPNCSTFVYLDDAMFTGNRVVQDVVKWIAESAPSDATLHIIMIAMHSGGQYYANNKIENAIKKHKKNLNIKWWSAAELEDRKAKSDVCDVLRPTTIPDDPYVASYVSQMKHPPTLRTPGSESTNKLFSNEQSRHLLEQEFLKFGAQQRAQRPQLGITQRPLGHISLDTLGFGSLIVTFRNCPNNAPLALWVGDHPLFPRKTNSETAFGRNSAG